MWVTVKTKDGNLIRLVYRPGSLPGSDCHLINYLPEERDNVIMATDAQDTLLVGVFNGQKTEWFGSISPTDQAGTACKNFCFTNRLVQLFKRPTRNRNTLYLVVVDSPSDFSATGIAQTGTSDHTAEEVLFKKISSERQTIQSAAMGLPESQMLCTASTSQLQQLGWCSPAK